MPKIVLTEAMLTKVPTVDAQHRALVDMMNALCELHDRGASPAALLPPLKKLATFTAKHFAWEEKEMKAVDYRDFAAHKASHDRMLEQIRSVQTTLESGRSLPKDVQSFFAQWLEMHILAADKRYVPAIQGRVLAPAPTA